jgi:F-type H+-transporting ATPase subunit epsilon
MKIIDFKIVTPERVVYHDKIEEIVVETQDGQLTILPDHAPLVSLLKIGELRIKKDGHEVLLATSNGFVEVRPQSQVIILADNAERAENIDEKKAQEARERAQTALEAKDKISDEEYAHLQTVLDREFTKMKVAKKYRNLKNIK